MTDSRPLRNTIAACLAALALMASAASIAQHSNPYRAHYGWAKLPQGRVLGVVAGIYQDADGQHM